MAQTSTPIPAAIVSDRLSRAPALIRAAGTFYPAFAGVLLLLLFVGFSRTFFLQPVFDTPSLAPIVYAHGVISTSWFVLLLVQTLLVAKGSKRLHRQLGMFGGGVALAVVLTNTVVVFGVHDRRLEAQAAALTAGLSYPARLVTPAARVVQVTRDLGAVVAFGGLIGAGFLYRTRLATHKRLICLGSLALLTAALARVARLAGFDQMWGMLALQALLIGMLAIHDRLIEGRLHPVIRWGGPAFLAYLAFITLTIPALIQRYWPVVSDIWAGQ